MEASDDTKEEELIIIADPIMHSDTKEMSWYSKIMLQDNRSLLIHTLSDMILFYMFFSYIRNQFDITEKMIKSAKERLAELKEHYLINV